MFTRLWALAVCVGLLTACGDGSGPAADAPATSSPTDRTDEPTDKPTDGPATSKSPKQQEPGTRVMVAASDFGPVLFDGTGQAIYVFDVETSSRPRCYDACAEAWPPVLTEGEPVAGAGVKQSLLGTTDRRDGSVQVTYDGQPLYLYAHEGKHVVECHDVFLNGGNWYAVQPDGSPAPTA